MLEDIIKIIVFQIGAQFYGMEIKALAGILPAGENANISNAKHPNGGNVISVDHDIIPVLDLHDKLRISPLIPIENILIVSSSDNSKLAVPVDRADSIYDVPCQDFYPVPPAVQDRENSIIEKIVVWKEQIIPLLEPKLLFMLLRGAKGSAAISSRYQFT